MGVTPRRESKRADDSPRHVSALLKAAERDPSDWSLSDDGLADSNNLASIEEVGIEVTSVAGPPDQHSFLKTRGTYYCLTTNNNTGQGRQAQADDDSPRPHSNSDDRQSQAPLTALRKRIKTSKLEHKIVKHERSQRLFPSNERPNIGDGFEKSELHVEFRIVSHRRRKPWRRDAIVYKQLPIAGGPLPDVMFECSADELNAEQSGGPHHLTTRLPSNPTPNGPSEHPTVTAEQARNSLREETQANFNDSNHANLSLRTSRPTEKSAAESSHLSKRRVSFSDRDRFIDAQLSSIKAPPRPLGDPDDDDAEDSADDDEEVESETSKDGEEVVFQTVDAANRIDDELLVDYVESSSTRQELTPSEQPALRFKKAHMGREDGVDSSDDEDLEGATEARRSSRRRSIERTRLMEAEEPIDEFQDTMHAERMSAAVANHYARSTEGRTRHQPRLHRLRSILKSNTPLMPNVTYRPDDLEGNTRRNSRHAVHVEDSRYFSQASAILRDPDESNHKILPRRTRSNHSNREDEEQVEAYPHEQLHGPRQDREFVRDPQSSPKPERDLKSLTRQVSRANGTMSQSVRRRSTLDFDSPFKIPPIR
ncbi:hypothetical protein D0865_12010 [Hortaea werneckii]|uniref:Uncharacterized protein n=1 Tax=Hortaea werneckii TaxID=91943 RepID=A0A3M7BRX9_HORWE|nr:hypothetical protein D0865_12010 [Hortaea werneckii]